MKIYIINISSIKLFSTININYINIKLLFITNIYFSSLAIDIVFLEILLIAFLESKSIGII